MRRRDWPLAVWHASTRSNYEEQDGYDECPLSTCVCPSSLHDVVGDVDVGGGHSVTSCTWLFVGRDRFGAGSSVQTLYSQLCRSLSSVM